ncbi:MAG: hypothetical protein EXQ69_06800 [Acidimicrobiia bacterium]|nr:hypothetical protein [Acidimicrobiia bacterium]
MNEVIGSGTSVFETPPVTGIWKMLNTPDDVLELMDTSAEGVVAGVKDAGATFLAPIFDELAAVVCMSGTPSSHIGIVSREYRVPCMMASEFLNGVPIDGTRVIVDCSTYAGLVQISDQVEGFDL